MDYSVASRIRVRLHSGKFIEAEITAITDQSTGRKLQIVYGNVTASINPAQHYRSSTDNVVPKQLQVGSTALARLHNGREVEAKVTRIIDSVVGRKTHIVFGAFAIIVRWDTTHRGDS
jgi:hypothetical protein